LARANSVKALPWCAAALPNNRALRSPPNKDLAMAWACAVAVPAQGASTPFSAAMATAKSAKVWAQANASVTTTLATGMAQASAWLNAAGSVITFS